ncbi:hypothetical protein JTB14_016617 [Gonioctena quinquepunctata]|nr:hypothetical protein JTB14_016617 [Gonioctena quinquepunctata]
MKFQSGFRNGLLVQYIASITCALASMSFGLTNGWMSPFLPHLLSDSSLIPMTSSEASWCAVASQLGCLIGAFIAANLADRIGRKYTILMMAPMVFACQIGIGYVRHVWYLFLLRMIIGIADGSCSTTIPMYVGEIASPDIRGFLSSLTCLFFISGTLTMNIIGSYLSIWTCSLICACIPAVHFAAFIFMPESPYYYIKRKKYELAERSLKIFQGSTNVTKDMEVLKEANSVTGRKRDKPQIH